LRAIFLSDVHLGTQVSKSERLLDFLRHHEAETLYLVGDIVDGWRLRSRWHWPKENDEVIGELLAAAQNGTRVIYLPGNHDDFLCDYPGIHFAGIEVLDLAIHTGADGRRYVVTHGDQLDRLTQVPHRVAAFGARLNAGLFAVSEGWNRLRLKLGLPAWSLSQWTRQRVKRSTDYLGAFERQITQLAAEHDACGVICGHVHQAAMHERGGVLYINCGDWLESCTAVIERFDGAFEIKSWLAESRGATHALPLGELQEA
jgi:UDP-2,3-diacylglucosamine pyrophosphatase LpxH